MDVPAFMLRDGTLGLRPAGRDHVSTRYAGWLNDPEVVRYTEVTPGNHTPETVRRYIETCIADPSGLLLAIEEDEAGHIGNLRIGAIDRRHGRATIALIIGEKTAWGKGLASRAIRLASEYSFRDLQLRKLCAGIYSVNHASRKAFENAGYACEGTLRRHAVVEAKVIDVWLMARFADA